MAENTTEQKPKVRKPKAVKEVAETAPEIVETAPEIVEKPKTDEIVEEVLKDTDMKSEDPEASSKETAATNLEILEKQSVDPEETTESPDPEEPKALKDSPEGAEQPSAATKEPTPSPLDEIKKDLAPIVEDKVASGPAEIAKLNPNLADDKSKWVARLVAEEGYHILFKGSFGKAYRVADNYNKMHGFPADKVRKVRQ